MKSQLLADLDTQIGRDRAYRAALQDENLDLALEIARLTAPSDATEQERREWSRRRRICNAARATAR